MWFIYKTHTFIFLLDDFLQKKLTPCSVVCQEFWKTAQPLIFKNVLNAMTQRNLTLFLSAVLKQRMKTGLEERLKTVS